MLRSTSSSPNMSSDRTASEQQCQQVLDFHAPEHYDYDLMLSAGRFQLSGQEQEYLLDAIRFSSDCLTPEVERPAGVKLGQHSSDNSNDCSLGAATRKHAVDGVDGGAGAQSQDSRTGVECGLDQDNLLLCGLRITAQEFDLLGQTFRVDQRSSASPAGLEQTQSREPDPPPGMRRNKPSETTPASIRKGIA